MDCEYRKDNICLLTNREAPAYICERICGPEYAQKRHMIARILKVFKDANLNQNLIDELDAANAEYPPLHEELVSLAKASVRSVGALITEGKIKATDEEIAKRREICTSCQLYIKKDKRCVKCGCYGRFKTWLFKGECPKGKWDEMTAIILVGPRGIIADINMTIRSVIDNADDKLYVIVVLDGFANRDPILKEYKGTAVEFIELAKNVGQRVALNKAVEECKTKYFCRLDAHCTMNQDWDSFYKAALKSDNDLIFPAIYKLTDDNQLKSGSYGFVEINDDGSLNWQSKKGDASKTIEKSMSLTGCGWVMTKKGYQAMGGMDESLSIWGGQGLELSLKIKRLGGHIWLHKGVQCGHRFNTPRTGYTMKDVQVTRDRLLAEYKKEFQELNIEFGLSN